VPRRMSFLAAVQRFALMMKCNCRWWRPDSKEGHEHGKNGFGGRHYSRAGEFRRKRAVNRGAAARSAAVRNAARSASARRPGARSAHARSAGISSGLPAGPRAVLQPGAAGRRPYKVVHEATFRRGVVRLQASDQASAAIALAINEKINVRGIELCREGRGDCFVGRRYPRRDYSQRPQARRLRLADERRVTEARLPRWLTTLSARRTDRALHA
jgi:hypothetical protein